MPGKTAKVTITERQNDILRTIQNAPTASSQLRQRAAIILLAFNRQGNPQIAAQVGLSRRQVSLWRRRWADAWDRLIRIECLESHAALRRAIEQVLRDEPRSGPPGKFTPEQIVQILAVACERQIFLDEALRQCVNRNEADFVALAVDAKVHHTLAALDVLDF